MGLFGATTSRSALTCCFFVPGLLLEGGAFGGPCPMPTERGQGSFYRCGGDCHSRRGHGSRRAYGGH
uniref:Putative secreted peptide n=1 Tax=Anopheles braziliensis TaxID=58242 RepID=A0A2M3ZUK9_9DIPT